MNSTAASRPYVVAVGGFDPCGGAGILADIKTLETLGVFGLAAMTANTIQTEDAFFSIRAEKQSYITQQLEALLQRYPVAICKIGLTSSFQQLEDILDAISCYRRGIPVIWDPILHPTAGHANLLQPQGFEPQKILHRLTLITPNIPEFLALFPDTQPQEIAAQYRCNLLLKGGHADATTPYVEDSLYTHDGQQQSFRVFRSAFSKHGTGCVLSSAIAAYLARGLTPVDAVRLAQQYVARFIESTPSRLGIHSL